MSKAHREPPLLDATLRFDNLPATGRTLEVKATEAQRAAMAQRLRITAVDHLEAKLLATPFRGGIRVKGSVVADTVQPCVVTFEPVRQHIADPVDRILLPAREKPNPGTPGAEVFVDLDGDDLPDYFEGPEVDLSELISETIALALDPYPRAEGAALETAPPDAAPEDASPFAALSALRGGSEGR